MTKRSGFGPFGGLMLAAGLAACAGSPSPERSYLRGFAEAQATARPFAPITDTRPDANLPEAYAVQKRLIARQVARGDRVAGYRGGLMSAASLKGRGVTTPLVGVLFASGRAGSGDTVSLCPYRRGSFEAKLGFVFGEAVRRRPADLAALSRAVREVVPAADLPDIGYRDPDKYGAVDMVAANITAAHYVLGAAHPPAATDLNSLRISVSRDGQPQSSGLGRESLGDQWESLRVVVEQILATGRTIAPGDLVLTGRIGERGWLPPGDYRFDYGPLGKVRFAVKACETR